MKNLTYLVSWEKEKEKTWSGICFSLYKALQKYYKIEDVDVRMPFIIKLIGKVLHLTTLTRTVLTLKYFRLLDYWDLKFKKRDYDEVVFQFVENIKNKPSRRTYVYQDLCSEYLLDLYQNNKPVFDVCNFYGENVQAIKRRIPIERNYYDTCSGIFTMGKWLAQYMVSIGIPSTCVHCVGGE